MPAILLLIGLPIAFSIMVVFLMTVSSHSLSPTSAIVAIAALLAVLGGAVMWSRRQLDHE
jgi:hypothetical protein